MTDWENYLTSIYYDPKHSSSFAGPTKLYHEVKIDGRFNISLSDVKEWLQKQDVYSRHRPKEDIPQQ